LTGGKRERSQQQRVYNCREKERLQGGQEEATPISEVQSCLGKSCTADKERERGLKQKQPKKQKKKRKKKEKGRERPELHCGSLERRDPLIVEKDDRALSISDGYLFKKEKEGLKHTLFKSLPEQGRAFAARKIGLSCLHQGGGWGLYRKKL